MMNMLLFNPNSADCYCFADAFAIVDRCISFKHGSGLQTYSLPSAVRIEQSCGGTGCHKKLVVNGHRNLVFIGHFPKLKMCEGSGNTNAGQANCCVLFSTPQNPQKTTQ